MTKTILTTTGFIMPESTLYSVFEKKHYELDDFIGRENHLSYNTRLDYFTFNKVQFSPPANEIYRNYTLNRNFKNFMAMVDFSAEILSQVDVKGFLKLQATNRYCSKLTIMFLRDLLEGKLSATHMYDSVPADCRFVTNDTLTKHDELVRINRLLGLDNTDISYSNWPSVLCPLMEDEGSFVTFFRYLFVDKF